MENLLASEAAGIGAALTAPFVMTLGFILWDDHWKGSAFALNLYKCSMASLGFLVLSLTTSFKRDDQSYRNDDTVFPADVFTVEVIGFLFLSSTIGIIVGDWAWLQALQLIGAKHVIMIDSIKPFLAALFGWVLLGEQLRPAAFGGIVLTVFGIAIVSFEQEELSADAALQSIECLELTSIEADEETKTKHRLKSAGLNGRVVGFGLALLNVVLDTYGSVLTKQYGVRLTVWEINLLRFGFAAVVLQILSAALFIVRFFRKEQDVADSDQDKTTPWFLLPFHDMTIMEWIKVSGGVSLVTFATPALSNFALFQIALALALTLGSIGPLYQLPLGFLIQKRRITIRSACGALSVVAGVAILAFRGDIPER